MKKHISIILFLFSFIFFPHSMNGMWCKKDVKKEKEKKYYYRISQDMRMVI